MSFGLSSKFMYGIAPRGLLGGVIAMVNDNLIAKPITAPFTVTGPADPYTRDTGSVKHAVEFNALAGSEFDVYTHYVDTNNFVKVEQRGNIIYATGKLAGAVNDFRILFGTQHGMATAALVRIESADGFHRLYRDGVEYPGFAFATPGAGYSTIVASHVMQVDWVLGTLPTSYTFTTGVAPFAVTSNSYNSVTDKATFTVNYNGTPIGYEYSKNGGAYVRAIKVSNTIAGTATYETGVLGVVGANNITIREVNVPANFGVFPVEKPVAVTYGMNLAGEAYFSSERVHANLLRSANWQDKSAGYADALPGSARVNIDGELISVGAAGMYRGFAKCEVSGTRCRLKWQGGDAATVSIYVEAPFSAANQVTGVAAGFKYIDFDYTHGGFSGTVGTMALDIVGMTVGDPIRNIDCRELTRNAAEVFTTEFIARHSVYNGSLRFMDMMNANASAATQSTPPTWAQRSLPGKFYASLIGGAPMEDLALLANAINPPVAWFNPFMYTDDASIASMLQFLNTNISANIKIGIEPGNEPQNSTFPLWGVMRTKALAGGRISQAEHDANAGGGYEIVLKEQAFQLTRWSNILAAQNFPVGRFIRIMGVLGQGKYAVEQMYGVHGCTAFDVVAHAPYVGATLMNDGPLGYTPTTDLTVAFARLSVMLNREFTELKTSNTYIKSIGRRHWCYEWQQHYVLGGAATAPEIAFNTAFQADDRMRQFTYDGLIRWSTDCGDLMTCFTSVGQPSQYGSWGFLPFQGATEVQAPKRTALVAAIATTTGVGSNDLSSNFADSFTGQVVSTPLYSRAGWGAWNSGGAADINRERLFVASEQIGHTGTSGGSEYLVGRDLGAAALKGSYFRFVITDTTSPVRGIMVANGVDEANFLGVFFLTQFGVLDIIKRVGGVQTVILSPGGASFTAGDVIELFATDLASVTPRITMLKNGQAIVSNLNMNATGAAAVIGQRVGFNTIEWGTGATRIDTVYMSSMSGSVTVEPLAQPFYASDFINSGMASTDFTGRALAVSGTYSTQAGQTAPTGMQIAVVDELNPNVFLQNWTTVTGFTATAGAWSGTGQLLPMSETGRCRVRFLNDMSITSYSTATTAIGILAVIYGQSNAGGLTDAGSIDASLDAYRNRSTYSFNGSFLTNTGRVWSRNANNLISQVFSRELKDIYGIVVGVAGGGAPAQPASALQKGATPVFADPYNGNVVTANYSMLTGNVTAAGGVGRVAMTIYDQGEAESETSGASVNFVTYASQVTSIINDMRTDFAAGRNVLAMINITGRITTANVSPQDANTTGVRKTQKELTTSIINAAIGTTNVGIAMSDEFHYTSAGNLNKNRRLARSAAFAQRGIGSKGSGPQTLTGTRAGAVITLPITANGATSYSALSGVDLLVAGISGALTSWQVSADDFATMLAVSSVTLTGTNVVITLAATPGGAVKVRNHYGKSPDITSWVFGTYADAFKIALEPMFIPITVT